MPKDKIFSSHVNYTPYLMEAECKECHHSFLIHSLGVKCPKCKNTSLRYENLKEWTCPVCKTISLASGIQSCPECKIVTSECTGYCKVDPETLAQRRQ